MSRNARLDGQVSMLTGEVESVRLCESCGRPLATAEWKTHHRRCYAEAIDVERELERLRRKWPDFIASLMGDL